MRPQRRAASPGRRPDEPALDERATGALLARPGRSMSQLGANPSQLMGDQPPHGRISSDVNLRILRRTPLRATSGPLRRPSVDAFVDSVKTELIPDRVWRTRRQLELALVEYP